MPIKKNGNVLYYMTYWSFLNTLSRAMSYASSGHYATSNTNSIREYLKGNHNINAVRKILRESVD